MRDFLLSPAAQADLDAIWDYTTKQWSVEQAEKYVMAIRDACRQLTKGTRRSEPVDEIRQGYQKSSVASHLIFFRVMETGTIDIIRILHQRMDHATQLEEGL